MADKELVELRKKVKKQTSVFGGFAPKARKFNTKAKKPSTKFGSKLGKLAKKQGKSFWSGVKRDAKRGLSKGYGKLQADFKKRRNRRQKYKSAYDRAYQKEMLKLEAERGKQDAKAKARKDVKGSESGIDDWLWGRGD